MTDVGTTQDNFILPAPRVGGLPISQDWLDRMKLVYDHTIPIILPSGKNILADTMFKITIGYTNLGTRQIQCRLDALNTFYLQLYGIGYVVKDNSDGERRKEMFYLTTHSTHFYLQLYGIRHMVKDHSDSEKGNPLLSHGLLFPINSNGSFICIIPQTG